MCLKDAITDTAPETPRKDIQTVDPDGNRIAPLIQGVKVRSLVTHPDDRGSLTELYRGSWDIHPDPLVYVKLITIRPGKVKGWVKHLKQDDRMAVLYGAVKVVLYDDRVGSPTQGMVNELNFGGHNRSVFTIPAGVYHALKSVDIIDAILINMPNQTYNHADPDKYRLPLDTPLIPYVWTV
jgi:dTDP-4-dehydrorhamnose 3,5-epimerase